MAPSHIARFTLENTDDVLALLGPANVVGDEAMQIKRVLGAVDTELKGLG